MVACHWSAIAVSFQIVRIHTIWLGDHGGGPSCYTADINLQEIHDRQERTTDGAACRLFGDAPSIGLAFLPITVLPQISLSSWQLCLVAMH